MVPVANEAHRATLPELRHFVPWSGLHPIQTKVDQKLASVSLNKIISSRSINAAELFVKRSDCFATQCDQGPKVENQLSDDESDCKNLADDSHHFATRLGSIWGHYCFPMKQKHPCRQCQSNQGRNDASDHGNLR